MPRSSAARVRRRSFDSGKECKRYIPLNILNSSSAFLNFQREKLYKEQDEKELIEKANVLWDTFREYEIPVVTIYEKTIKAACRKCCNIVVI